MHKVTIAHPCVEMACGSAMRLTGLDFGRVVTVKMGMRSQAMAAQILVRLNADFLVPQPQSAQI